MSTRPWMPLYVADYRADTAHLGAAEHGAYLLLIMHYWQTGSLPTDDTMLSRIACMTPVEWRKAKSIVQAFFAEGWKHKRIDDELARAADISNKRRASVNQRHNKNRTIEPTKVEQLNTHAGATLPSQSRQEDSEPRGSGAEAPRDIRHDLFDSGLKTLATITGKTPDSCRSLVGKWLKSVNDEAIHVLGAIEDAERNRVADPVAWINKSLQPRVQNGFGRSRTVQQAAADQLEHFRKLNAPAPIRELELQPGIRDGTLPVDVRMLPPR